MALRNPETKVLRRQQRNDKIVSSVETAKQYRQPSRVGLKLSQPRHTGRVLPVHSTSYAALFFLLLFTGIFLFVVKQQSATALISSGDITTTGVVTAVPPANAAVITSPANNTRFNQSVITVSGTCENGLLVEIYRNGAFAGSQICTGSNTFSLQITIVPGTNQLIAKISNSSGQYGPDSPVVTVYFDKPAVVSPGAGTSSVAAAALPFLILTQPVQRGIFPDQAMVLDFEVDGGVAPYAISIDWGDDSRPDVLVKNASGDFRQTHIYDKPGQFVVTINGTDSQQNKAFIQSLVIVNGQVPVATTTFGPLVCGGEQSIICTIVRATNMLWPVFVIAMTMTVSFWLGERLVLHKYKNIINNA